MKKINLFKISQSFYVAILLLILLNNSSTYSANTAKDEAEKVAKSVVSDKEAEIEKEKALMEYFYNEGERFLAEGDYESSIEQFSRILEVNPDHKGAKSGIERVRKIMEGKRKLKSPAEAAKQFLRRGRIKYSKGDYTGALKDFQDALVLDYADEDTLEWIKRTRRRISLDSAEDSERDLLRETELATQQKTVQEKAAMLEVEKAYLPPEKPERKGVEIEEMISPEEEREEKARQELLKKLQEKMVPAISLMEADIRDVIRQLMDITGVTIVIDEAALAKGAGEEPLRITCSTINPMPLLEILGIALKATELSYRVEPNYIWISSPEKLEKENIVTRTYRLRYGVRRIRKVALKEFKTKTGESSE